jgi:hypothetical protein
MKLLLSICLWGLTLLPAFGLTTSQRSAMRTTLESAKTAELPEVAETLMREAKASDRSEIARIILEYIVAKRAAAAHAVFASMSKLYPDTLVSVAASKSKSREPVVRPIHALQFIPTRVERQMVQSVTPPNAPTPPIPVIEGESSSGSVSVMLRTVPVGIVHRPSEAVAPATGIVTQSNTPINQFAGGRGDGTFIGALAIPAVPGPDIDYSQPRH